MLKIGSIISNRVILAMTHKFVLAQCIEESPEPFTVWRLYDDMSGVHSGSYFKDKMDAEWEFCSQAFPWFQDNVIIQDPDEKTAPEGQAQEQAKIDYISNGSQGISQAMEQINQAKNSCERKVSTEGKAQEQVSDNLDVLVGLERLRILLNMRDKLISDLSGLELDEGYDDLEKSILTRIYDEMQLSLDIQRGK